MKKFLSLGSAVALMTACGLYAQTTSAPAKPSPAQIVSSKVTRLTAVLDLTSDQQTQATTIFTTEQTSLSGLSSSLKSARSTLETAVQSNDTAGISTDSAQVGSIFGQEVLAQATADASFYAILTPDQQTKYQKMLSAGVAGLRGGRSQRP